MVEGMAICPDCGSEIMISGKIKLGRRLNCPDCGARLEIVETVPVELDFLIEDDEEEDL